MTAVLLLSNCDSESQAERIAEVLLERRLAAAVQIVGPTRSRYRWQGRVRRASEWLLLIRTRAERERDVEAAIRQLHSYRLPGLLRLDVSGGAPDYLQWIVDNATAMPADRPE